MAEAWRRSLPLAAAAAVLLLLPPLLASAAEQQSVAALEARAADLRRALAANPSNVEGWLELAGSLHQLDHMAPNGGKRVPEAAAAYRKAAELAGDSQPAAKAFVWSNLGALLMSGGQVQEAAEVMNATLVLTQQLGLERTDLHIGNLFNLAKAEQQLGHQEAAQALLAQVLQQGRGVSGPSYMKAWAALKAFSPEQLAEMEECARYLRRAGKGVDEARLGAAKLAAWRRLRERWGWLDGLSDIDKSWLYFGLFAAYQKAGRYNPAWAVLAEGNRLQDEAAPHDTRQDDFNTEAILLLFQPPKPASANPADAYYAALMRGAGGHRDPRLRPVFVVGMPRSGSTLIEQILASHSQVWGAGEDTALAPLVPQLLAVLNTKGDVPAEAIAAVGARYAQEMAARRPPERREARWVVDKMLRNAWNIGFIAMMLGDACIIHAARHPADAGLSCFAQPFEGRGTPWAANLSHIAHQVGLVQRLMDHWDTVLPGRVLHVRYEDLVRDQEGTTRRMLAHCGIPWEDAVLRFHQTQRTVATASLAQVRQRLYRNSVGRYRQYARHLAPLLRPLRHLILRYEREAGLESSAALLDELLGPPSKADAGEQGSAAAAEAAEAAAGGSAGSGDGGDGSSSASRSPEGGGSRDELR